MKKTLIKNAGIVTETSVLENSCLMIENGKIQRIYTDNTPPASPDRNTEVIDASGCYLCPGFIDLHIHGLQKLRIDNPDMGGEALSEICRILPKYGVTGFLPTVAPMPEGQDARLLKKLSASRYEGAEVFGFHLEGPCLSETGALPPEALGETDIERIESLIEGASPYRIVFSISPEFPNIKDLLPAMTANGNPAFITHTRANVEQTLEAIEGGARHATHFYDVFHLPDETDGGVRPCGAVEAILASPEVSVDFILDGVHVDPIAVKMALQCKDANKVCLITDANMGAGLGPGKYSWDYTKSKRSIEIAYKGAPARLTDTGGLAGSGLTLNLAVKNAVEMLGVSLPQAVRMASSNPAEVLGLSKKGIIREGFDADIVMLDDDMNAVKTWVNGVCRYG